MSAAVCGSKRSFFEDLPSPSVSKRLRCGSSASPNRLSPPPPSPNPLDRLRELFPHLDPQVLERALEKCGNDLDSALRSLQELCLGSAENKSGSAEELDSNLEQGELPNYGHVAVCENPSAPNNFPVNGAEWVDLFVREMMSATSMDDAKARASSLLEILEKSISVRVGEEVAQGFNKENVMLKEQIEVLIRENSILKRAVAIQHERQKEHEDRSQEMQHLKQLVSQYQEQLRTLEVNNYALTMHLKHSQQSSSIPGRFHPDVF
ncbi:CUE domain-containing protein [Cephalotus follicularis]|uniref:CUE domain-containing protein n=1 Tax=Cephalotus follicularis TaxID=3775 RepID=A0A1Q3C5E4_CEPFO|nr:CUE domain-containing protein [Cephalotus follicularis]